MKKLNALIVIVVMIVPGVGITGEASGVITDLRINTFTHFVINMEVERDRPACATSPYWAVDIQATNGKALLSGLMMAHSQSKKIFVWGNNTCYGNTGMEFVRQIRIF